MREYKGKASILDEVLGDYKDFGFNLKEPDDHILELYFKDKLIATYNQSKATFVVIREGCKNYMAALVRNN